MVGRSNFYQGTRVFKIPIETAKFRLLVENCAVVSWSKHIDMYPYAHPICICTYIGTHSNQPFSCHRHAGWNISYFAARFLSWGGRWHIFLPLLSILWSHTPSQDRAEILYSDFHQLPSFVLSDWWGLWTWQLASSSLDSELLKTTWFMLFIFVYPRLSARPYT